MPHRLRLLLFILISVFLTACRSGNTADTTPAIVLTAGQSYTLNGEGDNVTTAFKLEKTGVVEEGGIIRIAWDQQAASSFKMDIVNEDETLLGTPWGRGTVEQIGGPSKWAVCFGYIPGNYYFEIEADGPWEVMVEQMDEDCR